MLNRLRLIVLCCTQHCSPFAVHALPQHNTGLLCPEVTNMAVHNAHQTPNSLLLLLLSLFPPAAFGCTTKTKNKVRKLKF